VARNYALTPQSRSGITAVDTAVPAAPEDSTGMPSSPLPTSVWSTQGADKLKLDIAGPAGATGNFTATVYAWNRILRAWVSEGVQTIAYVAPGDFSGRLFNRATMLNWCSDFVFVAVTALGTGGGGGVGTTLSITSVMQDK